jgi:hypothetical protein
MNTKRRLTVLVWLIAALVASCQPVPPTPTDTPLPPTITPVPDESLCRLIGSPENITATNGFFVDNQIIVIGDIEGVNAVIGEHNPETGEPLGPGSAGLTLNLIQECDLSFWSNLNLTDQKPYEPLTGADGKESATPPFSTTDYNNLVYRFYEIPGGTQTPPSTTVETAIQQIITSAGDADVFPDANWLADLSGPGSCGDPYSGGGSPYSGGGSPYAGPGIPDRNIMTDMVAQFENQWAIGKQPGGIELPSPHPQGAGVRIAVFDTAPFGLESPTTTAPNPTPVAVPAAFPAWPSDLRLIFTDEIVHPLAPINPPAGDLSDHGLFVAGLIHAIAPESEIHLIRVLNDDACSSLNTINTGLINFVFRMVSRYGNLSKTVINLSFGIHVPDSTVQEQRTDIDWFDDLLQLITFKSVLFAAHGAGAVIVAASGNDAALQMQEPARYDDVIGVAASNQQGGFSCYSNPGDVAAPGGDGGQTAQSNCASLTGNMSATVPASQRPCNDFANCPYGVISLSQSVTGGPGYIFWSGSSFSTALVAGHAALAYEQTGVRERSYCMVTIATQAANRPVPNVTFGLIDVNFSLSYTSC